MQTHVCCAQGASLPGVPDSSPRALRSPGGCSGLSGVPHLSPRSRAAARRGGHPSRGLPKRPFPPPLRGRRHLIEQIEKNEELRAVKAEQRDQEAQDMTELLERMQFEDERVSREPRRALRPPGRDCLSGSAAPGPDCPDRSSSSRRKEPRMRVERLPCPVIIGISALHGKRGLAGESAWPRSQPLRRELRGRGRPSP